MHYHLTLFARYKRTINNMWADGQREYTANDLNLFVGNHENSTPWKRMSNNRYYTTRTYQGQLRDLGCITKIHRGKWKINGPIPDWFGSFHLKGLLSKEGLKDLEKSSFYWQSLPAEHKVNPWKNTQPNPHKSMTKQSTEKEAIKAALITLHGEEWYNNLLTNTASHTEANTEAKYTIEEISTLLQEYFLEEEDTIYDATGDAISNINSEDIVALHWDSYSKMMDVNMDLYELKRLLGDSMSCQVKSMLERFPDYVKNTNQKGHTKSNR